MSLLRKLMSYLVIDYFISAAPKDGQLLILSFLRLNPFLPIKHTDKLLKRHTVILEKAKCQYRQSGQNNNPTHQIITEPIFSENVKRNAYCKSRSSANALPYCQPKQKFLLVFRYFFRYFYFNQFADLLTLSLRYVSPKLPNSLRLYPASAWLSDLKCRR